MDLSQAMIEVIGKDQVRLSAHPWTITAHVTAIDDRPALVDMRITNPHGITAGGLASLPIRHITMLAAETIWGPEERIYRALAKPLEDSRMRPARKASRPHDHYQHVMLVARWAARSGRPGGPAEAIAEFWGVHVRTGRRWLATASAQDATNQPAPAEAD